MRNILIVAFDGLQPAQVTPALMPNLAAFVAEGVAFDNHHPVYPSVTRINAATMVTGRYPGAHGLAANMLVMRDYDPYNAFSALEPTLAEVARKTSVLLAAHARRYPLAARYGVCCCGQRNERQLLCA